MPKCVVKWCNNHFCHRQKTKGITYHRFPPDTERREIWTKLIRNILELPRWFPSKTTLVCSAHFEPSDFFKTSNGCVRLSRQAIPTKLKRPDEEMPREEPASAIVKEALLEETQPAKMQRLPDVMEGKESKVEKFKRINILNRTVVDMKSEEPAISPQMEAQQQETQSTEMQELSDMQESEGKTFQRNDVLNRVDIEMSREEPTNAQEVEAPPQESQSAETQKLPDVRERKKGEVEKFKRRIIRAIARYVSENETDERDMWNQMQRQTRCNCELLWKRMRALTIKKIKRLLPAADRNDNITNIARLTATDWLLFDLVLVHEKIDVIGQEIWESTGDEPEVLYELFFLVQEYLVESLTGTELVDAWLNLTREYNEGDRKCSPMMLQRRWYQMKQAAKERFYNFWGTYRGHPNSWDKAQVYKPTTLQVDIVRKYRNIIVDKFPEWAELIADGKVILAQEFDERITAKRKGQDTCDNQPEIEVVEQNMETINLACDSDSEISNDNDDNTSSKVSKDESNSSKVKHAINIKTEPDESIDIDEMDSLKLLESINIPCETPFGQIEEETSALTNFRGTDETNPSSLDDNTVSQDRILKYKTSDGVTMPEQTPCDGIIKLGNISGERKGDDVIMSDSVTCNENEVVVLDDSIEDTTNNDDNTTNSTAPRDENKTKQPSDNLDDKTNDTMSEPVSCSESKIIEQDKQTNDEVTMFTAAPCDEKIVIGDVYHKDAVKTIEDNEDENFEKGNINMPMETSSLNSSPEHHIFEIDCTENSNVITNQQKRTYNVKLQDTRSKFFFPKITNVTSISTPIVIDQISAPKSKELRLNMYSSAEKADISNDSDNLKDLAENVVNQIRSNKDFIGNFEELPSDIQFVDDGIVIVDEEGIKDVKVKIEIKDEIEETSGESGTGKIDLKLLLFPTVYTKKLDHMDVFKFLEYDQIRDRRIIECASIESKPIDVSAVKMDEIIPPKEEPIDAQSDTDLENSCEEDDMFWKNRISENSWLFKKPQVKNYNPIQLCKNPDFNTRLKRLTAGFQSYERNRQYLKQCQPLTIDLHKSFEIQLIDQTVYLKPESVNRNNISKPYSQISTVPTLSVPRPDSTQNECDMNNIDKSFPIINTQPTTTITQNVPCERNKVVNLPDINEVRRINQKLLCAEVAPIQASHQCPPVKIISTTNASDQIMEKHIQSFIKVTDRTPNINVVSATEGAPNIEVAKGTDGTPNIDVIDITDNNLNTNVVNVTDSTHNYYVDRVIDNTSDIHVENATSKTLNINNIESDVHLKSVSKKTVKLNSKKVKLIGRLNSISNSCTEIKKKGSKHAPKVSRFYRPNVPWMGLGYRAAKNSNMHEESLIASDTVDKMLMLFAGETSFRKKKTQSSQVKNMTMASIPESSSAHSDLLPSVVPNKILSKTECVTEKKKRGRKKKTTSTMLNKSHKKSKKANTEDFCCWARKKVVQMGVNDDLHLCQGHCVCCCRHVLFKRKIDGILGEYTRKSLKFNEPIILSDDDSNVTKMIDSGDGSKDESSSLTPIITSTSTINEGIGYIANSIDNIATPISAHIHIKNVGDFNSCSNVPMLSRLSHAIVENSDALSKLTKQAFLETHSPILEPPTTLDAIDVSIQGPASMFNEKNISISMDVTGVTSDTPILPCAKKKHHKEVPDKVINVKRSARTKVGKNSIQDNFKAISYMIYGKGKKLLNKTKHVLLKNPSNPKTTPIFIDKNNILLATKPIKGHSKLKASQLCLPNGVQFMLLPNGELALSIDPGVELDQNHIPELQSIISHAQKYLDLSTLNTSEGGTVNNAPVLDNAQSENSDMFTAQAVVTQENLNSINGSQHGVEDNLADVNQDLEVNEISRQTGVGPEIDVNHCEKNVVSCDENETMESSDKLINNEEDSRETIPEKPQITEKSPGDVVSTGRKTILSDLMEMSGISEEDANSPTPLLHNPIMTINPLPLSLDEIQQTPTSVPESTQDVIPSDIIESPIALASLASRPNLKIVTTYSELKSSFSGKSTFYKLDITTGAVVPVNVCIKQRAQKVYDQNKTPLSGPVVDLTDDTEDDIASLTTDIPKDTDTQVLHTDDSLSIATPVKLFKAIRPSILRSNSKGFSLLKTSKGGIGKVLKMDANNILKIAKKYKRKQALDRDIWIDIEDLDKNNKKVEVTTHEQTILEESLSNSNEDSDDSDNEPLAKKFKRKCQNEAYTINCTDVESEEKSSNEQTTLLEMPNDILIDHEADPQPEFGPSENDSEEDCILGV